MIRLADNIVYITVAEAAKILNVSNGRVYQFLAQERIPSITEFGRRLLPRKAVLKFARTRNRRPGRVPKDIS